MFAKESLLEQLARLFLPGASTNGKRLRLHPSALLDLRHQSNELIRLAPINIREIFQSDILVYK